MYWLLYELSGCQATNINNICAMKPDTITKRPDQTWRETDYPVLNDVLHTHNVRKSLNPEQ
jgi:hypothetical protein